MLSEHLLTLAKSVTYLDIEIDVSWNNQIEILAKENSSKLTEFFLNYSSD